MSGPEDMNTELRSVELALGMSSRALAKAPGPVCRNGGGAGLVVSCPKLWGMNNDLYYCVLPYVSTRCGFTEEGKPSPYLPPAPYLFSW